MRNASLLLVITALSLSPLPARAVDEDAARGQRLFARCSACHATAPGENRIGPSLSGISGRPAGKVAGARYSRAMANAAIVWDDAALDAYLANPARLVPGTTMMVNVPGAGDRADIIAYLRSLGPAGAPEGAGCAGAPAAGPSQPAICRQ